MSAPPVAHAKLAIDGGTPVRKTLLPYGRHSLGEDDVEAVIEVLRSDWLTTGPKVSEFEEAFAARVGAKYAVSFSSGTAALHGAVHAAGLSAGDEAITTPLSFVATANAVLYEQGRPVFADIRADTLNLDPERVAEKIGPRTKAILPVDYAGQPCDLGAFGALAAQNGLVVIEDASHALGATYSGREVGSVADLTTFSFHPVKHVAAGEGGMVSTNHAKYADSLRRFRNHGIDVDARQREATGNWFYQVLELGANYRLSDIACALGLSQLRKLDSNLSRRRAIATRYTEAFEKIPSLRPLLIGDQVESVWHLYPVLLDLNRLAAGRAEIFRALRAENIGVNVHYIPIHLHRYYVERFGGHRGEFPIAEDAYERLISLPMFHAMTDGDVEDVIAATEKVMVAYAR